MAQLHLTRLRSASAFAFVVLVLSGCERRSAEAENLTSASTIFDDASPEAREALAITIDYRLTDANFARWERARRNLDRLPRSAIPATTSGRGNVIDRAVARLESSPYARTAIESAGISVRDFVLETIALAQATEIAQSGRSSNFAPVPPDNFRFVERYRERILRAQSAARVARTDEEGLDTQSEMDEDMQNEPDADDGERSHSDHDSESEHRSRGDHEWRAQIRSGRDSNQSDDDRSLPVPSRDSTRDSVRDTLAGSR